MNYQSLEEKLKEERKINQGRKLAIISKEKDNEKRREGKILKVYEAPANNRYKREPAIRVAGFWLQDFGFQLGDKVRLKADKGKVIVEKII